MANATSFRKAVALLAAVPLVIGLAACSGDNNDRDSDRDPEPQASENNGGGGGGLLPFGNNGPGGGGPGPEPTQAGPEPTQAGPEPTQPGGSGGSGGSGGGNGTDVVRFGDTDLSHIDWDVICSEGGANPIVTATDGAIEDFSEDSAVLVIRGDGNGKLESLSISDADYTNNIWYSKDSTPGDFSFEIKDGVVTTTGEAPALLEDEAMPFEVRLTCDTTY